VPVVKNHKRKWESQSRKKKKSSLGPMEQERNSPRKWEKEGRHKPKKRRRTKVEGRGEKQKSEYGFCKSEKQANVEKDGNPHQTETKTRPGCRKRNITCSKNGGRSVPDETGLTGGGVIKVNTPWQEPKKWEVEKLRRLLESGSAGQKPSLGGKEEWGEVLLIRRHHQSWGQSGEKNVTPRRDLHVRKRPADKDWCTWSEKNSNRGTNLCIPI